MPLNNEDIPRLNRRFIALAQRDPRRGVAMAQRLYQQVAATEHSHAWAAYTLGMAFLQWERLREAGEYFDEACALFEVAGNTTALLRCRHARMIMALSSGAGASGLEQWSTLATEYEAGGNAVDAVLVRLNQASHFNILGLHNDVLQLLDQIAPTIQAMNSTADYARLLRIGAIARGNMGRFDEAARQLDQSLAYFAALRRPVDVAKCRIEQAWLHQRRERFAAALDELQAALKTFRRFDMPLQAAFCEKNIGVIASRLGRYDQALASTLQARNSFIALRRMDFVAHCAQSLGIIAYYSGMFDLALAAYRQAQAEFARLGLQYSYLVTRRNEALVLRAQGRLAEALAVLNEIDAPARDAGDRLEWAEILLEQGRVQHGLGDSVAALACAQCAEAEFTALGNEPAAAECRLEQGWLYLAQGAPGQAAPLFRAAQDVLANRPVHAWRVDYGLARCADMNGDQDAALHFFQAASTTVARLRRTLASEHASSGIFAQAQQLLRDALHLAATRADPDAVLFFAEQQRAIALQRQPADLPFHFQDAGLQEEYAQARTRLRRLLDQKEPSEDLGEALLAYTELLLRARHSVPPAQEPGDATLDLPQLRTQFDAAYPAGWTALVYAICDDDLLIVTIDAQTATLTHTPFDARLKHLVQQAVAPQYRRFTYFDIPRMHDPKRAPWEGLADLARRLLPDTVRRRLHPEHRLLLVPVGPLHAVPWAALRVGDSWLCERAVVQVLPALSLWSRLAARRSAGRDLLALGCRSFGARATDLPGVATELDLITACWPAQTTRLEDEAATRAALVAMAARKELGQYGLIHIASHAQMTSGRGLLAHIKLWDDDLLLDEVSALGLAGALVVLATCDGATSEVLIGEEVLSLSRALLAAGARDVVASLWPIYDAVVHVVLERYYTYLAQGHDAPTALALAQRSLLRQDSSAPQVMSASSPLVWGSFSTMGAGT